MAAPIIKCRVCTREGPAAKAHVMPRWCYGAPDDTRVLVDTKRTRKPIPCASGLYDRMSHCCDCEENYFQRIDNAACNVIRDGKLQQYSGNIVREFVASILLRAHNSDNCPLTDLKADAEQLNNFIRKYRLGTDLNLTDSIDGLVYCRRIINNPLNGGFISPKSTPLCGHIIHSIMIMDFEFYFTRSPFAPKTHGTLYEIGPNSDFDINKLPLVNFDSSIFINDATEFVRSSKEMES